MKTFILSTLILASFGSMAQKKENPRTEFIMELSTHELEIKAGETKDVTVDLLRSKGYNKSKAKLGLSSSLPKDVTLVYDPAEGVMERSIAKITVAANAKPGTYQLMLNCTINNKSKGTILKLMVKDASGNIASGN
ncbi:MAG: hypothetical protein ACOYXT_07285 [Bacteroidota bacterium]